MNEYIADFLAQNIIALPYITKSAGCVQELIIPLKNGDGKKVPAAKTAYITNSTTFDCLTSGIYSDLIPNRNDVGIAYFEDLSSRRTGHNRRREVWRGELKFVCWLQIDEACGKANAEETLEDIKFEIRSVITREISNQDKIQLAKIFATEEYPKRPSPFDKYDYNEKERQYLISPFDYFSLRIEYIVYTAAFCLT